MASALLGFNFSLTYLSPFWPRERVDDDSPSFSAAAIVCQLFFFPFFLFFFFCRRFLCRFVVCLRVFIVSAILRVAGPEKKKQKKIHFNSRSQLFVFEDPPWPYLGMYSNSIVKFFLQIFIST